jgi:hypothetical protein
MYDGALRPWRLSGSPVGADGKTPSGRNGGVIHVQGVVLNADVAEQMTSALANYGGSMKTTEWDVNEGDVVECDVKASPRRTTTVHDRVSDKKRRRELDPVREGETPKIAYERWLTRKLMEPRVGAEIDGKIKILSTRHEQHVVGHKTLLTPCVRALVDLKVLNLNAFVQFMKTGIGPLKHIGMGSVFPLEMVDG